MQSFREALAGRPGSQGGKGTPLQQQQHLTAHATTSSLRRRGAVKTLAMFGKLFKSDPAENTRKKYQAKVEAINALEPKIQALSDDQLRAKTQEFKQRVAKGESLESLLPEAFAVGRVHAQRVRTVPACTCAHSLLPGISTTHATARFWDRRWTERQLRAEPQSWHFSHSAAAKHPVNCSRACAAKAARFTPPTP